MGQIRPSSWFGYSAATLLLVHALLSYYWAMGGEAGVSLLSEGIRDLADERSTWFVALLWGVALLKTGLALLAIALTREWRIPLPRWMPLLTAWSAGAVMSLYGAIQIASLTIGGLVIARGEDLPPAFWPYLLLWMPLWLAIGVTYLLTAWRSTAMRRNRRVRYA